MLRIIGGTSELPNSHASCGVGDAQRYSPGIGRRTIEEFFPLAALQNADLERHLCNDLGSPPAMNRDHMIGQIVDAINHCKFNHSVLKGASA